MIAEGTHIHVRYPGGWTMFARADRIDYARRRVWTGKWWVPLELCEPA